MSRLQASLRAYPPGSYLHGPVSAINQPLFEQEAQAREAEILEAKAIQARSGCTWANAIRQAQNICATPDPLGD